MMPLLSMMKPEPSPSCLPVSARGAGPGTPNCSRSMRFQGSSTAKRRMNLVLWMVTTAPFTRSTSGATLPTSTPGGRPAPAPAGGAACADGGAPAIVGSATATTAASAAAADRRRSATVDDDAASRVIRRQRHGDLVAEHHADAVLAELSAEVSEHLMAVLELDAKIPRWEHLDDAPLKFYMLFSTHRRADLTCSNVLGQ